MCRQSCGFGFFVIDGLVEHIERLVDNLTLFVSEEERAITLDLGTVGHLRQDGTQLGKVVEELLLLGEFVLAAPVLVKLIRQKVEWRKPVKAVFLGDHDTHVHEGGGAVDAGLLHLEGGDDSVGFEHQWKQALLGKASRGVDDEVKVLIAHGADKVEGLLFAAELGAGDDLIEGLELWPAFPVLLVLLDDAALWVGIEHDEAAMVFEDQLVGEEHADGSLAAATFLIGDDENLVASLLRRFPDVEKWYVHKVGCW